jgi:hypothetical protein
MVPRARYVQVGFTWVQVEEVQASLHQGGRTVTTDDLRVFAQHAIDDALTDLKGGPGSGAPQGQPPAGPRSP